MTQLVTLVDLAEVVRRERQLLDPSVRAMGKSVVKSRYADLVAWGVSNHMVLRDHDVRRNSR